MTSFRFKAHPIAIFLLAYCAAQMPAQAPQGYTLLYQNNFDGTHVNKRGWGYRVDRRQLETWANGLDRAENVSEHDAALHLVIITGAAESPANRCEYLAGAISDLRIYNRALSENEITKMGAADNTR